jgi:hypothetical protein
LLATRIGFNSKFFKEETTFLGVIVS